ncbi:MAG: 50S ribosomal protein L10 [Candidatus Aminicenantes bacterium]|nr:50S ribosomal protein L10 [Candidatus Aminicenantes bacterium]
MKREKKDLQIKQLSEILNQKDSFYLMDFTKVTVGQSVALRKALRKKSHVFRVVKNRLALKAFDDRQPKELKPYFQKPTAIAYTDGDPVDLAKSLKDFASQHKVLTVKGGVLQGQIFGPDRFEEIVALGSQQEMLARFASLMAAPLSRMLSALRAPLGSLGGLLGQFKARGEGGAQ